MTEGRYTASPMRMKSVSGMPPRTRRACRASTFSGLLQPSGTSAPAGHASPETSAAAVPVTSSARVIGDGDFTAPAYRFEYLVDHTARRAAGRRLGLRREPRH